jgi:hypothetical protein
MSPSFEQITTLSTSCYKAELFLSIPSNLGGKQERIKGLRLVTVRSAWRTELKLNSIFSRQFDQKRQFRLSFFEFFSASRKETIKTARHAHHDHREVVVPEHSWRMGNSFGKKDYVTPSPTEQRSAEIYLDFTGFNNKCFIGGAMKVRRRNVGGRSENPQHAKGAIRLFRTYQNIGFLPKRSYNTAVVDSDGVGCNILNHGLTRRMLPGYRSFTSIIVRA